MADIAGLNFFQLDAIYRGLIPDTFDPGFDPDFFNVWCEAIIRARIVGGPKNGKTELRLETLTPPQTVFLVPVRARIETGVLRLPRAAAPAGETPTAPEQAEQEDATGVRLLAKSTDLGLGDGRLIYDVSFGLAKISGSEYQFETRHIEAPTVENYDPEDPLTLVSVDLTTEPDVEL